MEENKQEEVDFKKIGAGVVVGLILLGAITYVGYSISQKRAGKTLMPAGKTYLGQENPSNVNPPTAPQRFTAGANVTWKEFKGKSYTFSYPETLQLAVFPNDPADSVAVVWGNIPAELNILLNIEKIADRDPKYIGKVEELARNWWKFFSGLKGLKSIEKFNSTTGLTGYRVIYINSVGQSPNVDIFFEIPDNTKVAHIANGVLDPEVFNRIVDSFKYVAPASQ